jgi:hypothetical protein
MLEEQLDHRFVAHLRRSFDRCLVPRRASVHDRGVQRDQLFDPDEVAVSVSDALLDDRLGDGLGNRLHNPTI